MSGKKTLKKYIDLTTRVKIVFDNFIEIKILLTEKNLKNCNKSTQCWLLEQYIIHQYSTLFFLRSIINTYTRLLTSPLKNKVKKEAKKQKKNIKIKKRRQLPKL